MKKDKISIGLIILFFLLESLYSCLAQDSAAKGESDLNLEKAIRIAFKNNKDIQIQEQEISVSFAVILEAKSRFLPHADLDFDYSYNYERPKPYNKFTGFKDDNSVGLILTENIYSGGFNLANLRQSQVNLIVSEETLRAKKLDLEFEAKRLYYGLLLAYETERIASETLKNAQEHCDDVRSMYEQGTASRFDLLQSEVQVSLMVPDVVKAQNEINSLKAELNKLLARKVDVDITTEEKLVYTLTEIKETEFLQEAYLSSPVVKLKLLGVDISKWSIQMAKAGYRPQVDISVEYNYRDNSLADILKARNKNLSAGVSVRVPIFEGFSTLAKVRQAKAHYAQAVLGKENVYDQLAVDVKNSCLDLASAESIINSQKDNVFKAREALRLSEVSYANGVAKNIDVLDAQVSLDTIQKNLAAAIYDYLMAQASLDRNMGRQYLKETKGAKNEAQ